MSGKRFYVAYGSNMNLDQMSERYPDDGLNTDFLEQAVRDSVE